jgi:hypothetical protein
MTHRIEIALVSLALVLGACSHGARLAKVSQSNTARMASTAGGGIVRYEDAYREGYEDAVVANALEQAMASHAAPRPAALSPGDAAPQTEQACLRAQALELAHPGTVIPPYSSDAIVPAADHPHRGAHQGRHTPSTPAP